MSLTWTWIARGIWLLLPIAAGDVLGDALDGWERAPAIVAAVLCWVAWTVGLVALLAPRPWGLTALRVIGPAAVGVTLAAAPAADGTNAVLGIAAAVVAAVLALSAPVSEAAGNALAYGDEVRFALRIPTPLLLGPVPLAVAVVAAGLAAGPLLLAAGNWALGAPVAAFGACLALLTGLRLHALARRWIVLVPAGLVVVDPLTLADPILVRREQIESVYPAGPLPQGTLDLRLGTTAGSVVVVTREPVELVRRTGRRRGEVTPATAVACAPLRPAALLDAAAARRIPTTTSTGFGDSRRQ